MTIPHRIARELVYQLDQAGEPDRLARALSSIPLFMALYAGESIYEVLAMWARLAVDHDIEGLYLAGLEESNATSAHRRDAQFAYVADLFSRLTYWDGSIELQRRRLAIARDANEPRAEADARTLLAEVLVRRSEYDAALREVEQAIEIFDRIDDLSGAARSLIVMGLLHQHRDEQNAALECFQRSDSLYRIVGDQQGMARAASYIAGAYHGLQEYDLALEELRRSEAICRRIGERFGLIRVLGNIGILMTARGDHDGALECFRQLESMSAEIGDRHGIYSAENQSGNVCFRRNDLAEASKHFARACEIAGQIGDKRGRAFSLAKLGNVHSAVGEYEQALDCLATASEIFETIGDHVGSLYVRSGEVQTLVGILEFEPELPAYLVRHLPELSVENWRIVTLRHVRSSIDEVIDQGEEHRNPEHEHLPRLIERIEALEATLGPRDREPRSPDREDVAN